ncbi:hypothetical protein ANCCEY_11617 [Ancylostoma ceylanicum]|uniref:Uncharacterized protein n=1 Tax=Ancylostoma ceylanicum TaxID=53326 RepID=A0A0D6LBQ7_9BILA|nr:hypothetical protein ANCCEY_11617 [Ancylostoma ceylanicum]
MVRQFVPNVCVRGQSTRHAHSVERTFGMYVDELSLLQWAARKREDRRPLHGRISTNRRLNTLHKNSDDKTDTGRALYD